MKSFILVLVSLVIVTAAVAEEKRTTVPLDDSPSMGPAGAPVIIVEFIDFQ